MAEEIRRVETVEERPRDTVVVSDGGRSNALWVVLGIIVVLLLVFYLWGNPFIDDTPASPTEINVPNQVDVDVPSPDVNLPDVDINTTPNDTNPAQ